MQWGDTLKASLGVVIWSLFPALQTLSYHFFPKNSVIFSLSPPVQREDSYQHDFCMYQGEEHWVSDF